MSGSIYSIGIIGGGAWGTALAVAARHAGRKTLLWARDQDTVRDINTEHENRKRLPGVPLDPGIEGTSDPADLVSCDALVLAVPAQTVRQVVEEIEPLIHIGRPMVIAAKGLERVSGLFLTDLLAEALPEAVPVVLSGPSFASDVARGLPTAITLACRDETIGKALVDAFGHSSFRPYRTTDMIGTQIGGAVKNVLAIACGAVAGRRLGASALAALVARGFAEMNRFGQALGARPETLSGLSGLGDLVLTATSPQSRNFSFGRELGRGGRVHQLLGGGMALTEGAWTASAVVDRAYSVGVEMPICQAVAEVVDGRLDVDQAVENLLARPFKEEG